MTSSTRKGILLGIVWLSLGAGVFADAIVTTRAMTATTIAEVDVTEGEIRVELEIGVADLRAFRNVLPPELLERLELEPTSLTERLPRFFAEDWIVRADGGEPMVGRLQSLEGRPRVVRDEITGQPLPASEKEPEPVVYLVITYPLPMRPATLSFQTPGREEGDRRTVADVGFIVYHEGLPVMDFRYLSQEETLDLDWEDPWFSRFRNRNLKRRFDSPLSVFLYVEPYEVRKEIIIRPRDLERWVDLGFEGATVIPAERWGTLKQEVADFLAPRGKVLIDGREIEPVLDRIHFIQRSLRTTGVIEPAQELPLVGATLGVIFVYPVTELPEEVTMEWDLFDPVITQVPTVATDEAGGLPYTVTADDAVLRWQNFLTNPTVPTLIDLGPLPAPPRVPMLVLTGLLAAASAWLFFRVKPRTGRVRAASLGLLGVALISAPFHRGGILIPFVGGASVDSERSAELVTGLLSNVYRAFDFREESDIYDVLAQNVTGELLNDIYLETRRALELENQGGARAKIQEVVLVEAQVENLGDGGFVSRCTWNVSGSVGHWGHLHQRRNQYQAALTVEPIEGAWKVTDLELFSEKRL